MTLQELIVKIGADIGDYVDNLDTAISKAKSAEASFASIGTTLSAGLTAPLAAIGGAALKAASDIGAAFREIRTGTGATGDALNDLKDTFKTVFADVDESASEVGKTITELSRRLGLTGEPLAALSKQVLDLAEVTKSDLNQTVESTAKVFGAWGVEVSKQADTLDYFLKVSQNSGIGIVKLETELTEFAPVLKNFGFSVQDAALLLGSFEKGGVEAATVMPGLTREFNNLAKAGISGADGFKAIVAGIEDGSIKFDQAQKIFGKSTGTIVQLIQSGKFSFDALKQSVDSSSETISKLADETETLGKAMGKAWNQIEISLQPLGGVLKTALRTGFDEAQPLLKVVRDLGEEFAALPAKTQTTVVAVGAIAAAIGPAALAISGLQKALGVIASVGAGAWGGITSGATAAVTAVKNISSAVQNDMVASLSKGELALLRFGQAAAVLGAGFVAFSQFKELEGHLQTQEKLLEELSPKFKDFADEAARNIRGAFEDAVPAAVEYIRKLEEKFPELADAASDARGRIKDSFSDISHAIRDALSPDPVQQLKTSIKDAAGPIGALNSFFDGLEAAEKRLIENSKLLQTNFEQMFSDVASANQKKFQDSLRITNEALEQQLRLSGKSVPSGTSTGSAASAATAAGPRLNAPTGPPPPNIDLSGIGKGAGESVLSVSQLIEKQNELIQQEQKAESAVANLTAREQVGQNVAIALSQAHEQLAKVLKDVAAGSTDVATIMKAAFAEQGQSEARINALGVALKAVKENFDRTGEGAAVVTKLQKEYNSALEAAGKTANDVAPALANVFAKYSDATRGLLADQQKLKETAETFAGVFNEVAAAFDRGELKENQLQKAFTSLKSALDAAGLGLGDLDTKVKLVGNGIPVLVGGVQKFVLLGADTSKTVTTINQGLQDMGAKATAAGGAVQAAGGVIRNSLKDINASASGVADALKSASPSVTTLGTTIGNTAGYSVTQFSKIHEAVNQVMFGIQDVDETTKTLIGDTAQQANAFSGWMGAVRTGAASYELLVAGTDKERAAIQAARDAQAQLNSEAAKLPPIVDLGTQNAREFEAAMREAGAAASQAFGEFEAAADARMRANAQGGTLVQGGRFSGTPTQAIGSAGAEGAGVIGSGTAYSADVIAAQQQANNEPIPPGWKLNATGTRLIPDTSQPTPAEASTSQLQISGIDPTLLASASAVATAAIHGIEDNTGNLLTVAQEIREIMLTGNVAAGPSVFAPSVSSSVSGLPGAVQSVSSALTSVTSQTSSSLTTVSSGLQDFGGTLQWASGFLQQMGLSAQDAVSLIQQWQSQGLNDQEIADRVQHATVSLSDSMDQAKGGFIQTSGTVTDFGGTIRWATQFLEQMGLTAADATSMIEQWQSQGLSLAQISDRVQHATVSLSDAMSDAKGGFIRTSDAVSSFGGTLQWAQQFLEQMGLSAQDAASLIGQWQSQGLSTAQIAERVQHATVTPSANTAGGFTTSFDRAEAARMASAQAAEQQAWLDALMGPTQDWSGRLGMPWQGPSTTIPLTSVVPPPGAVQPGGNTVIVNNPTFLNRSMLDELTQQLQDLGFLR